MRCFRFIQNHVKYEKKSKNALNVHKTILMIIKSLEMSEKTKKIHKIYHENLTQNSTDKITDFRYLTVRYSQFALFGSTRFWKPARITRGLEFSTEYDFDIENRSIMKFANEYNHHILIGTTFREKLNIMKNAIRLGSTVIFCAVNKIF